MTSKEMADGARAYIYEQDKLTKLTGMSAQKQQALLDKAREHEQFNAKLRSLELKGDAESLAAAERLKKGLVVASQAGIEEAYMATVNGNLTVTGNTNVTGNVTIGGNITIGDALTDSITINASINSDLIPQTDNAYDLGSPGFRWRTVYTQNFFTDMLSLNLLDIGNLQFRDNEITTTTGQNLAIFGNGTGGVDLGNFRFRDNTITNIANNAISQILATGTGYFKIAGTNGVVLPRGANATRPTAYAVVGMTRFNTDSRALEVWDGFGWASPAGSSGAVTDSQAEDISVAFALTLG
jgi:hypothetical protein